MEIAFIIVGVIGVALIILGAVLDFDFLEMFDLDLDFFSLNAAAIGTGFTFTGLFGYIISTTTSMDDFWAAAIALLIGAFTIAVFGYLLGNLKKRINPVEDRTYLGSLGTVDVRVNGTTGKVTLDALEEVSSRMVRSRGETIERGQKIVVVGREDDVLIVAPLKSAAAELEGLV
jgi:membrane-bound ClpP family serine protease